MTRKNPYTRPDADLVHPSAMNRALIDAMPLVEWLTQADQLFHAGLNNQAANAMAEALQALQRLDRHSPLVSAYINWLEQNTQRAETAEQARQNRAEGLGPDGRLSPGGDE